MRTSDAILGADLRDAKLPHLADRAETGEWNDFFGTHDFPQLHLLAVLRAEIRLANVARKRLIDNILDGKYDATMAESDEWAASPEGQETFESLVDGN